MDMQNTFGLGAGLGGIGAGLAGMLSGGGSNPYKGAQKYYNQIPGTISPYFQPYINAGQQALPQLQQQFGNLMNDPTAMMNQIGKGYQQSPGFEFQSHMAQNAANNSAAAGGMSGTPANQYNSANMVNGLANQDYYNYLNHGLQQYGMGLQGMQGINQMGYGASDTLAEALSHNLMNQGNMAFSGQAAQNQNQGSMWGDLFGGIGTLAAFL